MSEHFSLPLPPLMSAAKARDIARGFMALGEHFDQLEMPHLSQRERELANLWFAYAQTLAATESDKPC